MLGSSWGPRRRHAVSLVGLPHSLGAGSSGRSARVTTVWLVPALGALLLLGSPFAIGSLAADEEQPPAWAYPVNPPDFKSSPDDGRPRHVPDSAAAFTVAQTRDLFFAPDWHPDDHPPLPGIVAHGRRPDVFACGFCHRSDGPGGPENASLAGLPADYIVQQMADFKSGARASALPGRLPPKLMVSLAKAATDAEIKEAADYFSALKPRSAIKVVETDTVPKTYVAGWFLAQETGGVTEPLGERIIEVPADLQQFENRDARSRFIAYVPVGSIEKGKLLATEGSAGGAVPCAVCHGPDLKGLGAVPALAGRSPSYLVRQLYDFKHGTRTGVGSTMMQPVAESLSIGDMVAAAAYAASLTP